MSFKKMSVASELMDKQYKKSIDSIKDKKEKKEVLKFMSKNKEFFEKSKKRKKKKEGSGDIFDKKQGGRVRKIKEFDFFIDISNFEEKVDYLTDVSEKFMSDKENLQFELFEKETMSGLNFSPYLEEKYIEIHSRQFDLWMYRKLKEIKDETRYLQKTNGPWAMPLLLFIKNLMIFATKEPFQVKVKQKKE